MNSFHSNDNAYRPRWLTSTLQTASQEHPIVVVTGARQVGKSTLLRHAEPFCHWRFLTLDDFAVLRLARERPAELWAGTDRVVLDEVQRAPELLLAIKQAVDQQPGRLHFALSGSANLLLLRSVSESLAGRAVYFVLHPMTLGEMHRVAPPDILARALAGEWPAEGVLPEAPPDPVEHLLRGFMPPLLVLDTPPAWTRWWDEYVSAYLERDLRQYSQIENLLEYRRLMELLALRSGQVINQSGLGRDTRLSQPTVHRYLNMLETTQVFARLPAYTVSHASHLLKAPKSFWNDPGLAVFLSGYFDSASLRQARERGAYLETMIGHHLRVLAGLLTPPARLYFWRTQNGQEVDFVVEHGRRLLAVEVTETTQVSYNDANALRVFLDEYPEAAGGLLLYGGNAIRRLGERIVALPWTMVTG